MKQYLFLLGSHIPLSLAELSRFVMLEDVDNDLGVALGDIHTWPNPRNLPKNKESIFQDLVGGVIRFGEVIGSYDDWEDLENAILQQVPEEPVTPRFRIGVSVFGPSSTNMRGEIIDMLKKKRDHGRFCNPSRDNMSSGRIFDERLLQKGVELLVWFKGDRYILAKTVANQNIRNYTVRDRKKDFRDAHMGMLPPKLAQMMLNICVETPNLDVCTVWDPFCGSGTVNIEAILMGYQNIGSDLDGERVEKSKENYAQMAEHFRFDPDSATFFAGDAGGRDVENKMRSLLGNTQLCVCTEGYLGENFRNRPSPGHIERSKETVLMIWKNVFAVWGKLGIQQACFCLPCWQVGGGRSISILSKIMPLAARHGFEIQDIVPGQKSYVYARKDAIVGREIVRVRKI